MRYLPLIILSLVVAVGCANKRSSLLLERQATGPIVEEPLVAQRFAWTVTPVTQTKDKDQIEITVNHVPREDLKEFFRNRQIFGRYAGRNPYYPEHLVFMVTVSNNSDRKIGIYPGEFTLVDDRGNQYSAIGVDYVTASAKDRQSRAGNITRGIIAGARPGYFGMGVPVGSLISTESQQQFALLKQSQLGTGYLYPGVKHDGLVAFWNPSVTATRFTFWVANVKTDYDANDEARRSLDFTFSYEAGTQ